MTQPALVEIVNRPVQRVEIPVPAATLFEVVGRRGETGPAGPAGPPGPPAEVVTGYQHTQDEPAAVWLIAHGLGFDPAGITVVSTDGFVMDGFGVQYLSAGATLRLSFDIGLAGVAYLS